MYTRQDYILFALAAILILAGLALLGYLLEWRDRRAAARRKEQLRSLNRHQDLRRRHRAYLIQMKTMEAEGLKSVKNGEIILYFGIGLCQAAMTRKPLEGNAPSTE